MKTIRPFRSLAAIAALFASVIAASAAPVSPEEAATLVRGYAACTGGALLDGTQVTIF